MPNDEESSIVFIRAMRSTWSRFRKGNSALPRGTWRRWSLSLLIGLAISCAFVAGVTVYAKGNAERLTEWDTRVLRDIEQGLMSYQNAILAESPGNLAYLIPLTTALAIGAVWLRRPLWAASVLASYWLARLVTLLGWKIWNRERPDLIADGIASPPLHSFPSGHVILAISVYGLLIYLWCRASRSWLERVVAILIGSAWVAILGYARLRLGSHWPSDVIAGAAIGIVWLSGVIIALRRAEASSDLQSQMNRGLETG